MRRSDRTIRCLFCSLCLTLATGLVLASCNHAKPVVVAPADSVSEITSPAGADSAQPNLAIGPAGETYLSWIETTDSGEPALKFAVRKNDQWSQPKTITSGDALYVNYADFPSLLPLSGGVLAAHWATYIGKGEAYRVDVAFSTDGGATWSKPVVPHRDRTTTEHGFVSMLPTPDGGLGAIWLDSRKVKNDVGDVAMMYTNIGADGKLGPELTIDNRVCECCQPSAVRTPNGVLAVYRDRSPGEIRDIAIVRYDGAKWSQPKNIYPDNWKINGCPINGPAISSQENKVAVAWFTAPNDKPKVQVDFSPDGGATFGMPVQVDEGNPVGRVGVVSWDSGSAQIAWLERVDQDVQLRTRRIDPDGTKHPSVLVGITSSGTSGGFPRIARSGDSAIFAWTDTKTGRVRVSVLKVPQPS